MAAAPGGTPLTRPPPVIDGRHRPTVGAGLSGPACRLRSACPGLLDGLPPSLASTPPCGDMAVIRQRADTAMSAAWWARDGRSAAGQARRVASSRRGFQRSSRHRSRPEAVTSRADVSRAAVTPAQQHRRRQHGGEQPGPPVRPRGERAADRAQRRVQLAHRSAGPGRTGHAPRRGRAAAPPRPAGVLAEPPPGPAARRSPGASPSGRPDPEVDQRVEQLVPGRVGVRPGPFGVRARRPSPGAPGPAPSSGGHRGRHRGGRRAVAGAARAGAAPARPAAPATRAARPPSTRARSGRVRRVRRCAGSKPASVSLSAGSSRLPARWWPPGPPVRPVRRCRDGSGRGRRCPAPTPTGSTPDAVRRGGVERAPSRTVEVDLGPGVQVAVGQRVGVAVARCCRG